MGYGLYLTAATLFGFNGTVSKTLLATGISAARLSQLRVTLALVVLLLIVLATRRASLRLQSWAELRLLVTYGVFGVMLTQFLYFVAIHLIPVGITLIIEFMAPFAVALWMRIAHGERLSRRVWIGMSVALSGLVLIAQVWHGFELNGLGTLSAFGAMAALAVYFVMGERATAAPYHRDAVTITLYGFASAALVWAVVAPWWSFPWHYLEGSSEPWGSVGWRVPLPLLVASMVVLGTVTSFWLVVSSFQHINAAQASSIGMAEPVLASLIAWLLIGEALTPWQVVGIVITGSGILFAERSRFRPVEYVD